MTNQELTNKLILSTKSLIDDLVSANVITIGCFITVKTETSMLLLVKVWKNIGKIEITKVYEEIEVFNSNKELIDTLDGEFIGYQLFVDFR